jgi:hypothetical protein
MILREALDDMFAPPSVLVIQLSACCFFVWVSHFRLVRVELVFGKISIIIYSWQKALIFLSKLKLATLP